MIRPLSAGGGIHRNRVAGTGEIPTGEIEEMDRLLKDPVADAGEVVAPAVCAESVRTAPQLDESIKRVADRMGINEFFRFAPEGRAAQLVADREEPVARLGQLAQLRAVLECEGHRLFEQHI